MSDFRVQFISGKVPASSTQHDIFAGIDFLGISDDTKAFIIPATTHPIAGLGTEDGDSQSSRWALTARLRSTGSGEAVTHITLTRGAASGSAANYAFYIIEYIGEDGGANEFITRAQGSVTFAAGGTTVETGVGSNIVNLSRCVPFINGRQSDSGTNNLRNLLARPRLYNNGSADRLELTRALAALSTTPTYAYYIVEFTGSNWTIATGESSNFTPNTNKDTTISSTPLANTWLHTYYTQNNRDFPAQQTYYAWLSSSTNLRMRVIGEAANLGVLRYYIISNPEISVVRTVGVDGVTDWAAGTASAFVTTDATQEAGLFISGHAGSDSTTVTDHPSDIWRFARTSATQVEASRQRTLGGTEYVVQTIQLPAEETSTLTMIPAPAQLPLTGISVTGDLTILPGVAELHLILFGPQSEAFRTPATAALMLTGGSVRFSIFPATAVLTLSQSAPSLGALKIISPAIPDLDYNDLQTTEPTLVFGTALAPTTALVTLASLQHAAHEGGNILQRSPSPTALTITGNAGLFALVSGDPASVPLTGLAPTIEATKGLVEPGVGLLQVAPFPASTDFIHIPFQWLNYDPAPVVQWA